MSAARTLPPESAPAERASESPGARPDEPHDLAACTRGISALEAIFESWEESQRRAVAAYVRAIEELHAEALKRLIRKLKGEPAALAALKAAAADEVVYAVLRKLGVLKPSLSERVEAALDGIRPTLASHGGGVELVAVRPPAIEVRFKGSCDGCSASALTFHAGVKRAVEEACPEITDIIQVKGESRGSGADYVSPFAGGFRLVCSLDEIPESGVLAKDVDGRSLILSRRGSAVACFENACAHLGLPMERGLVEEGVIVCPHHGFRYDLATGECLTAPQVQLEAHAVRVIGSRVEARLAS